MLVIRVLIIFKSLLSTIQTPPGFERYDYNEYSTTETEHAFGGNVEFDLKINNQISGKVKFGFKNRDKTREHDRDYEYGAFTYVAHVGKRNET